MEKTSGQSGYSSRLFLPGQEYCFGWLSSQLHISKHHVGILKSDLQENLSQSELKDICPPEDPVAEVLPEHSSFPSSDSLTQYILYGDFHFYLVPGKYGFCYFGNHTLKITWKNVYRNPESDNWFFFPDQIVSHHQQRPCWRAGGCQRMLQVINIK